MRALALIALAATTASADVDKYKLMDAARLAIIAALDQGDAATFAKYIGPELAVDGLWFDTAACKKLATTKLTAKTAGALVACMKPLGVRGEGMLVFYGPGVELRLKIGVADGKATLSSMSGPGALATDPALPEVWQDLVENHRKTGTKSIPLDAAARKEIEAIPETGVVYHFCIDGKGRVVTVRTDEVAAGGTTAKQVAAEVKAWTFEPLTIRDKPVTVCTTETVKLAPH